MGRRHPRCILKVEVACSSRDPDATLVGNEEGVDDLNSDNMIRWVKSTNGLGCGSVGTVGCVLGFVVVVGRRKLEKLESWLIDVTDSCQVA